MAEDTRMVWRLNEADTPLTLAAEPTNANTDPLLIERGSKYGDYGDMANIGDSLRRTMSGTFGWHNKLNAAQRDALLMMSVKISRVLNGDPNVKDHWDDIAGYAKLAADQCA